MRWMRRNSLYILFTYTHITHLPRHTNTHSRPNTDRRSHTFTLGCQAKSRRKADEFPPGSGSQATHFRSRSQRGIPSCSRLRLAGHVIDLPVALDRQPYLSHSTSAQRLLCSGTGFRLVGMEDACGEDVEMHENILSVCNPTSGEALEAEGRFEIEPDQLVASPETIRERLVIPRHRYSAKFLITTSFSSTSSWTEDGMKRAMWWQAFDS